MTNDSHDELSFHVADGFEPLGHTGVQWPSLKDDSTEPPTDVVVVTDELLRTVEPPGVTPRAAPDEAGLLDTMKSPAVRLPSLPVPAGPTTNEALKAIRPQPRRWVMVAIAATFVVALFGGLLLREAPALQPQPQPQPRALVTVDPLPPPPLVPAVPELELVEFPAVSPAPKPAEVVEPAAPSEPPSRRVSRPARRPTRTVPATDLLDVWQ
ncbi:MAG: hypothetical protein JNM69_37585 [Archangium sp.]|nr:hypothetical protein [Archangium sp.]